MRIAVTGTPGVGKSTLCQLLERRGKTIVRIGEWARQVGAIVDETPGDTVTIDENQLDIDELPPDCFLDGHMSHLVSADAIWVIRLNPSILRSRLEKRGYSEEKIIENLEAEAMDLILQESLDQGVPVVQRDASERNAEDLLENFLLIDIGTLKNGDLEAVDWSAMLMDGL